MMRTRLAPSVAWILPTVLSLVFLDARAQEPAAAPALQPFVDRGTLAGAVTLVASRDRLLGLETVGFADVAARTPMREDSLFWIASIPRAG
jgi:CubicO group peptidase (beta-lactamase class C family)